VSTISYELFLPHVMPYVPNCFEEQALIAIRNACIDYCRDTLVLQQDIDAIGTAVGENTYGIDAPSGYGVTQVMSLYYIGRRLERKSELELQRLYTRDWQTVVGAPQVWTQFNLEEVVLAPRPAEAVRGALTGRIAIVPTRASKTIESVLYETYLDDIVAGALSRLKMTPDQPYSDYQGAALYATKFRSATTSTRAFVNGGMNHAPLRARFNRIW
jgi:hypothetical protein